MKTSNQSNNVVAKNNNVVNADTLEGLVAQSSGGKSVQSSAKSVRSSSGKQCNDGEVKVNSTTKTKGKAITTATKAPETIQAMIMPEETTPNDKKTKALILVTSSKTKEGDTTRFNAALAPSVLPQELMLAQDVKVNLCYNLMSGNVNERIMKADDVKGGLSDLFTPKTRTEGFTPLDKSDVSALRTLLKYKPNEIVTAWENHVARTTVRITRPTLQGIVKGFNSVKPKNETFKEKLTSWVINNKDELDELPAGLFAILVDAGIVAS